MEGPTAEEIRRARQELDAVIEEIQQVPGFEHFLATPTMADVSPAATPQPLVYLAAAAPGGLALVVRGDDVEHVPLDDLTNDAVIERVDMFLTTHAAFRTDREAGLQAWETVLAETADWLWRSVMGPVLQNLAGDEGAVLIAGGLLGLLPLHAARTEDATAPTGYRYALDQLAISYVPNARALTAARSRVTKNTTLVTVTDPSLPSAPLEVAAATAAFEGDVRSFDDPEASTLAEALVGAGYAHFACHGIADLDNPLQSRLLLAGGDDLHLRDLLALRLDLRLAVLSACETSTPGTDLPDEVVSLPTGLLQAGVGGVVASMWAVPDRDTAMLMVEFYRRWRWAGKEPLAALREAQQWLRDTTNAEKVVLYEEAAGSAWLPPEAATAFLRPLRFGEPDVREQAGLNAWAGFAYVGA